MKKIETPDLLFQSFDVKGNERTYWCQEPKGPATCILVVFHGNGGTADGFAKKYPIHGLLPDALVVYLQGIPGIGGGFDPKGLRNGWQRKKGDGDDRDLYAIDELVKKLIKQSPTLKNKVYAMGHSNGGRFTYLLWSERAALFNGFIINAHQGVDLLEKGVDPKSAMIITGKTDRVVNNANQLKSAELIKTTLNCDQSEVVNEELTIYSNKKSGLRLHHYIHGGGHDLPKTALIFIKDYIG